MPLPRRRLPAGWRLGAGALGAEAAAGWLHPGFIQALAAADVIVPLAIAVVLITAILCGSNETCDRVFRLLRCITNRPEPPAPGAASPGSEHPTGRTKGDQQTSS